MTQELTSKSLRLSSLDVFRGIAIACMIIVNTPGSRQHVYPPLLHAGWHGCTPADLVFPFFLFISGAAIAFSIKKYTEGFQLPLLRIYWKILRRCSILFALGLLLNSFPIVLDYLHGSTSLNFGTLRIMGVLQRISLAYLPACLAAVNLSPAKQLQLAAVMLLGYWCAMLFVPVPGCGAGNLSPEGNLASYIDRMLLTEAHMYRGGPFDPEGIFSTLPAAVTVLAGCLAGQWIRFQPAKTKTSLKLSIAGISCLTAGRLWGLVFPINKAMWTSSYVLFTAGWSLLLMAACYEAIEVRGWSRWVQSFEIMGRNSVFVYVASAGIARILLKTTVVTVPKTLNAHTWIYKNIFVPWAGQTGGSLAFALAHLLFWWLVLYGMYRRRWFVKI